MPQMFANRHALGHHDPIQREMNDSMPADGSDHNDSDHNNSDHSDSDHDVSDHDVSDYDVSDYDDSDHDEPADVNDTTRLLEYSEVDHQPIDIEESQFITSSEQDDFLL